MDFPRWSRLSLGDRRPAGPVRGSFCRASIDLARGAARLASLDDGPSEFPRIDDRFTGRRHRYVLAGADSGRHGLAPGEHDRLVRYDLKAGRPDSWPADASIGEVVFAPRSGTPADSPDELDGYYLTLARTVADDRSWLYVWDAADFPGRPAPGSPSRTACTPTGSRCTADAARGPRRRPKSQVIGNHRSIVDLGLRRSAC